MKFLLTENIQPGFIQVLGKPYSHEREQFCELALFSHKQNLVVRNLAGKEFFQFLLEAPLKQLWVLLGAVYLLKHPTESKFICKFHSFSFLIEARRTSLDQLDPRGILLSFNNYSPEMCVPHFAHTFCFACCYTNLQNINFLMSRLFF